MTSRELRRLGRRDLLELLIRQEQQNEKLRARVSELEELLSDRSIAIENCGTMAEAAMVLNSVFESADKAAAQYLESIKGCAEQQESAFNRIVAEAEQRAEAIIDSAEKEKQRKKREADAYARKLSERIEAYFKAHPGLYEQMKADEKK